MPCDNVSSAALARVTSSLTSVDNLEVSPSNLVTFVFVAEISLLISATLSAIRLLISLSDCVKSAIFESVFSL